MKIVLDTNVLISGLIKEGKPRDLLLEILLNHELVISREILEEVATIANEPRIRRYVDHEDITDFLRDLATSASIVKIKTKFRAVKQDPDDDTILRTAVDGRARLVVSGDNHLLDMKGLRGIRIVSVAEMLQMLKNC